MFKSKLAQRLVALRESRGLNQVDLSAAAGVANRSIQQIESGEGNPRLDTLIDLGGALKAPLISVGDDSTLARPGSEDLLQLINSPETSRHSTVSSVLNRLLNETPEVRAATLAVLYGDPDLALLSTSSGKISSR